ncbi:GIY-YIG nuclease family protein [Desulfonatronovibrio hydrogenovorans]|uniref:GIY-YIG nuclease family protein n=1 Tax=Desulfonatronovibrio hydrogenovorans TaxID=53245 RepID=UPI00048D982F|nr:GIY-YIG nuclease family protein [Desulfonatronovibrio hydrogenovorans]
MAFTVYILQSRSTGRYYCGQTEDLTRRIAQHNSGEQNLTLTTKRHKGPWDLVWSTLVSSRSEAIQIERKIKKRGIGRFLEGGGC